MSALLEGWGWGLLALAALAAALTGQSLGEMASVALPGALLFPALALLAASRLGGGAPSRRGFLVPGGLLLGALALAAQRGPEPWGAWMGLQTWGLGILAVLALGLWASPGQGMRPAAAVLASCAALAAYGAYQRGWGFDALERAVRAQPLLAGAQAAGSELAKAAVFARLGSREPMGTFALSNTLAALLLLGLPFAAGLALDRFREGRRAAAAVLSACALLCGTVLAMTGSKGAWIALAAAASAWAFSRLGLRGRIAAGALGLALLAWAWGYPSVRASVEFRAGYARAAARMVLAEPWRGVGLGGFEAEYNRYRDEAARDVRCVHCDPLQLWAEAGIWGPVALLWLSALLWGSGRRAPAPEAPSRPGWGLPALFALGVYVLASEALPEPAFTAGKAGRRAVSLVLAAIVLAVSRSADGAWGPRGRLGALAGLLAFGVHALGDFPLLVPGAALPAWILLGALAAQSPAGPASGRLLPLGAGLLALAGMGSVLRLQAPALGRERAAEEASQRLAMSPGPLPDEAMEDLRVSAQAFPERSRTWQLAGEAWRRAGKRDAAMRALARASVLRPGDANAAWTNAWLQVEDGNREDAVHWARRALEAFPTSPRNHLNAARLYRALGMREHAARERTEALRLDGAIADLGQRLTAGEREEARRP